MEKELSSKESLAIITQMISKAKKEAAGDGSFQLLLWGWIVAICNFGHLYLGENWLRNALHSMVTNYPCSWSEYLG